MSDASDSLRAHLARILDWEDAHVGFDAAVDGIPDHERGARTSGFEHSAWELIEHMRIAQKDILDFCVDARYAHALAWPGDYWPTQPAPAASAAWDESLAAFKADRQALKGLVADPAIDLFALVPTGKGRQTYLRAILLVTDHNAYHVGQLVALRRALGLWT